MGMRISTKIDNRKPEIETLKYINQLEYALETSAYIDRDIVPHESHLPKFTDEELKEMSFKKIGEILNGNDD